MRVITYARYSSDLQRDSSITDQQRECRAYAEREGWRVVAELSDAALSGATAHRPGFQTLRTAVRRGDCDIVLVEAIDRLSRNLGDTAKLFEEMSFAGVRLVTLSARGDVDELHIGLEGTMNARWLKEHGNKTRRGQGGNVERGRIPGGLCYGYDVVPVVYGESRGVRTINESQAVIVRRIFGDYANGLSPKAIARTLNREGIAPPRRAAWSPSTIHGHQGRGTGLLNNELYIGWLVWNRQRFLKNPETGKRIARLSRRVGELKRKHVPELRIVSDELWQAVKARQAVVGHAMTLNGTHRPKYLCSGLAKCALCGGGFTIFNHDALRCFNARERGTCGNLRRIKRVELERRVIVAMRDRMFDPKEFDDFRAGWEARIALWEREHNAQAVGADRERKQVDREVANIVAAMGAGGWSDSLHQRLTALEARQKQLAQQVAPYQRPPLPRPDLALRYRETVANLKADDPAGQQMLRRYIARIDIPPTGFVTVIGNMGALDGCGGLIPPTPPAFYQVAA